MDALNVRVKQVMDTICAGKAAVFAAELGVSQAIISHITSGRNKPGVELLQKIIQRYSKISAEWLLTGTGIMEKETNTNRIHLKHSLDDAQSRLQETMAGLKTVKEILKTEAEKLNL